MRELFRVLPLIVLLTGCVSLAAGSPQATPTPIPPTSTPIPTVRPTATARPLPTKGALVIPPTPRVAATRSYKAFVSTLCSALAARDAGTMGNLLPYYQYNSGVRYGQFGDGEGQTGDPSLVGIWLASGQIRCRSFSPDIAGHGTVLSSGWMQPGGWGLIEADTFNGVWKINDFTFGKRQSLYTAMQSAGPILRYGG